MKKEKKSKTREQSSGTSSGEKAFSWLIAILVPVILLMTAVRLLLTPLFVDLEYSMPGFPQDPYGMTFPQRRQYAKLALDYLLNDESIAYLGDQQFEDGAPLYNERELSHMEDVKELTQAVINVWIILLAGLAIVGLLAWRLGRWDAMRAGLARGGQITIGLILLILVFVALSFNALFTGFHRLFFEGDSWLFLYSDTLIRLFPLRFWQDVFIALGVLALLGGLGLWWWARPVPSTNDKPKRRARR